MKSKTPLTMTTLLFYLFFVNLWIAINSEYTSFVMYMMNSATNCVSLAPRLNVSSHLYTGLQTVKPGSVIMQDTSVIRCCMPHMDWGTGIPQWHHTLLTVLLYLLSSRCHIRRPAGAVNTTVRSYLVHTAMGLMYCTDRPTYQKVFMNVLRQSLMNASIFLKMM